MAKDGSPTAATRGAGQGLQDSTEAEEGAKQKIKRRGRRGRASNHGVNTPSQDRAGDLQRVRLTS